MWAILAVHIDNAFFGLVITGEAHIPRLAVTEHLAVAWDVLHRFFVLLFCQFKLLLDSLLRLDHLTLTHLCHRVSAKKKRFRAFLYAAARLWFILCLVLKEVLLRDLFNNRHRALEVFRAAWVNLASGYEQAFRCVGLCDHVLLYGLGVFPLDHWQLHPVGGLFSTWVRLVTQRESGV